MADKQLLPMWCKGCERRAHSYKCQVMKDPAWLWERRECWAWTNDPAWDKKVKKVVDRYRNQYHAKEAGR